MMKNKYPNRQSPRLPHYDYSQNGAYFITICTHRLKKIFGTITTEKDGQKKSKLSSWGTIAYEEWHRTSEIRKNVSLDAFIVMPNHIHGVVMMDAPRAYCDTPLQEKKRKWESVGNSVGSLVRAYKAAVTRRIKAACFEGDNVWQGNYYEHVVRNEKDLERIREYIAMNPYSWDKDEYFIFERER